MANFDFKTAVPDTNIAGTEYWFGADSQSAATPSIYSIGGLKTYLLGGGSLAITAAKTLTATNSLTLTGTDGTTMTFPSSSATLAGLGIANLFTTAQTISPVTDVTALTARSSAGGTSNILQLQDSSNNVLAAFDSSGLLTLGRGSGLTGQLKFSNATNNNLVTLQAGTTSGNITFTLPTADGTSGQVLQTNGSGVLSWKTDATNSPGGLDTQVQFNNSGSFGGSAALTFGSNTLTIGTASATTGILSFGNASSANTTKIQGGNASSSVTYTLPIADGSNGQVLSTNGSGTLSWKTDATTSPAGSDTQLQFNNSGAFGADSTLTFNSTSKLLTAQRFSLSGNISSAAWTTSGIRYANVAGTITDTSSSGTIATAYTNVYGGNTIAASNSTTFTNYFNTYIAAPVSGTNVTFTNAWALGLGGPLNISGQSLTGSQTQALIDLSTTWNTTGGPTAIKLNVTNTASSSTDFASKLLEFQVGSVTRTVLDVKGLQRWNIYSGTSPIGRIEYNTPGGRPGIIFWTDLGSSNRFEIFYSQTSIFSLGFSAASSGWGTFGINSSGNALLSTSAAFGWNSTTLDSGSQDLFLTRRGAANLRLGAADAAAPVAQTLSVQSVVAGTSNTAGTNFTITGSQGTGTGAGGDIIFQTAAAGSSGTSQNALATALTISSNQTATTASAHYANCFIAPNTASNSIFTNGCNGLGAFGSFASLWGGNNGYGITYHGDNHVFAASGATSANIYLRGSGSFISFTSEASYNTPISSTGSSAVDLTIRRAGAATLGLGTAAASKTLTVTLSLANPCVVTTSTAGTNYVSTGTPVYFTTTGSLPSPLVANTIYYAIYVSVSTIQLATTEANAFAGTAISTSGSSQSGTHTLNIQAVCQNITVGNVASGLSVNNIQGARFTINGSQGTGSAAGGSIVFQTAPAGSSGNSVNALTPALIIDGNGMLDFAGSTSSFPALKRSSTTLQVRLADDSGYTTIDAQHRLQGTAPASATATGTAGDIRYDGSYIYVCTATDTWVRASLSTWT